MPELIVTIEEMLQVLRSLGQCSENDRIKAMGEVRQQLGELLGKIDSELAIVKAKDRYRLSQYLKLLYEAWLSTGAVAKSAEAVAKAVEVLAKLL